MTSLGSQVFGIEDVHRRMALLPTKTCIASLNDMSRITAKPPTLWNEHNSIFLEPFLDYLSMLIILQLACIVSSVGQLENKWHMHKSEFQKQWCQWILTFKFLNSVKLYIFKKKTLQNVPLHRRQNRSTRQITWYLHNKTKVSTIHCQMSQIWLSSHHYYWSI